MKTTTFLIFLDKQCEKAKERSGGTSELIKYGELTEIGHLIVEKIDMTTTD